MKFQGYIPRLDTRQMVFLTIVLLAGACGLVLDKYALPAYGRWSAVRASLDSQIARYAELKRNLTLRDRILEQLKTLPRPPEVAKSDQIVLSNLLRELEELARHPSMTLINMKPMPVEDRESYKVYKVKLSVGGQLQEILRFASNLANGNRMTGVDSFTIRSIQGSNMVECSLTVWTVQWLDEALTAGGGHGD